MAIKVASTFTAPAEAVGQKTTAERANQRAERDPTGHGFNPERTELQIFLDPG